MPSSISIASQFKQVAENLAVSVVALAVMFLAFEFIVFRYVLLPDDELRNVTINGVVRYQPNTKAVFRHPDGSRTTVSVNAQGWNSRRPFYATERSPGVMRVAIVGDSYVHAKFVELEDGFPTVIERTLKSRGQPAEVYRFGMDGAPLSQYLHMLRREVLQYKPDVVVVPLVHNDFDESYRFIKTRYASSFLKLKRGDDGGVEEIPPHPFKAGTADILRASATFRYVYYQTGLYLHAKRWVSKYFWGGNEDWSPEFISSAVDIRKIQDGESNAFFARYVLREMKALAQRHGFQLILAMDGVRDAIYAKRPPETYEVWKLNQLARKLSRELELPLVDLHEPFRREFVRTGQRLEFAFDWHWNERGNQIVGELLAQRIARELKLPVLSGSSGGIRRARLDSVSRPRL